MKLDLELTKKILNFIRNESQPFIYNFDLFNKINPEKNLETDKLIWHHLDILFDKGLIKNQNQNDNDTGIDLTPNGSLTIKQKRLRLSDIGHQTIESLENDSLWKKLSRKINPLTSESIKLIPSLTIEIIKTEILN
ncbi:Hypothetical protein SAMN05444278_1155 [Psychroflexus salarius]|uniref:DUF2513 domain-containing protein n=1 Tax=Psychroflexus salarius TaxID=1155689 RepID=A0A1M4Y6S1_9FLAO|nr:DUF2513 domain-containing protein [Psychroflexus salarius]SHF01273.1 Hypothetical protein SAMN05444278_1155 [Psychroflexus salarius]